MGLCRDCGVYAGPRLRFCHKHCNRNLKDRARAKARYHRRRGLLVAQPCEGCGNPKVQMHHPDYGQPLAVRWLCHACHREEHRRPKARLIVMTPAEAYDQDGRRARNRRGAA